ncbi:hypothetical protein BD410DRAFT_844747 [Rickenella mellea]|uniref:Ribonuclease H1 N-terminal domain-containing protein n=1 Tax=Rickenella mellea TaxID=50990 RepID=A0A4Y7PLV4_9AGAM|nr:hypothetical protein BD410DRAFT_844747 [Rickenella mellea]
MAGQRDEDPMQNEDVQTHRGDTSTVSPPTTHIIQRHPQPASPIAHGITITIEFIFSFLWSIVLGVTQGFVNAFRRLPPLIQDTPRRLTSDDATNGLAAVNSAPEVPAVANVTPEAPAPVTNARRPKWYVVIVGRKTGIFTSNLEAQSQIHKITGNSWYKFYSFEEAQAAWEAALLRGDVHDVQDAAVPAAGLVAPPAPAVPAPAPAIPAPVVPAPAAPAPTPVVPAPAPVVPAPAPVVPAPAPVVPAPAPAPVVPAPAPAPVVVAAAPVVPAPTPQRVAAAPRPAAAPATPRIPVAGPSTVRLPAPVVDTTLVFEISDDDYDSDEPSPVPVRFKRNSCRVHFTGGR